MIRPTINDLERIIESRNRTIEILQVEREQHYQRTQFFVNLLMNITRFLPPKDIVLEDGRMFSFHHPDPHRLLIMLRDAIEAAQNALQESTYDK